MDRLKFWRCHISGFSEEAMTGLCPSCRNWGFTILRKKDGDEFICLRCDLKGKGIEDFIEQIEGYRLPELRRLVREELNKKILEVRCADWEDISHDEISFMVRDIEARREQVWDALAQMVDRETYEGDGRISGIISIDELAVILIEKVPQDREEIRHHLESLIQFDDIEVNEDAIIVRWLWRQTV